VLGVTVRRPAAGRASSRTTAATRRRLVVGGLLLVALVLVTLSFRESDDGPVTSAQNGAAAVLRPFQVAADRIAEPFRDAYGWFDSLVDARSDAERLQAENELLRQQVVQGQLARSENARLRELLEYRDGPRLPNGFRGLAAGVISRPAGAYAQSIVVAAGWNDGVRVDDPVVTADGLVGTVSASRCSPMTRARSPRSTSSPTRPASSARVTAHGRRSGSTACRRRPSSRWATRS
jgi:rod shape-determining protein MreC